MKECRRGLERGSIGKFFSIAIGPAFANTKQGVFLERNPAKAKCCLGLTLNDSNFGSSKNGL